MTQAFSCRSPTRSLFAGAANEDITPASPCFLHGYPGVARYSTGVHGPLECNALWLESDQRATLLLANDVIYVGKTLASRVRERISRLLPIDAGAIVVSATHTHSGPVMVKLVSELHDPIIPPPDPEYLQQIEDTMVAAAQRAYATREPAESGWVTANAAGIGTNRHRRDGPADLDVPVLAIRSRSDHRLLAITLVCTMHPTVLHEDSLLISGDFLGIARQQLRTQLASAVPILVMLGACGNQSPRHVTRANTFEEAERIARCLSGPVHGAIPDVQWTADPDIAVASGDIELKVRSLPDVARAKEAFDQAYATLESLRADGSPRTLVRTAECDFFGARTTYRLAQTQADGRLEEAIRDARIAEVVVIRIAARRLIAWPGEWFVEFQIALRQRHPDCVVVTMANGELNGYVVTEEAVREQWYEAGNAVFDEKSTASRVLELTEQLLEQTRSR